MSLSANLVRETALILGFSGPGKQVQSLQDLRKAVDLGLPESSVDLVMHELSPDGRRMVSLVQFKTPDKGRRAVTLTGRQPRTRRLEKQASEQTARLARTIALARYVWRGNRANVNRFLTKPHPMLGNEPPLKVAQSEIGARQVEDILWNIVFGLPA